MSTSDSLAINYRAHERVQELIDIIQFCLEDISLGFDQWDESYMRGPGLYVALVSGYSVRDYADPMGNNRWPVTDCHDVLAERDSFYTVANEVALTRDGAVVISVDGCIQEQMVRFHTHSSEPACSGEQYTIQYADWMGSRHMSAVDTSVRPDVITTITLSAETGRVTLFTNGEYETIPREELQHHWC